MADLVPKNLNTSSSASLSTAPMCGGDASRSYALHGTRISSNQIDAYIRRYMLVSPSLPPDSFDRTIALLAAAGAVPRSRVARDVFLPLCNSRQFCAEFALQNACIGTPGAAAAARTVLMLLQLMQRMPDTPCMCAGDAPSMPNGSRCSMRAQAVLGCI
jgi:hypothetical protein